MNDEVLPKVADHSARRPIPHDRDQVRLQLQEQRRVENRKRKAQRGVTVVGWDKKRHGRTVLVNGETAPS